MITGYKVERCRFCGYPQAFLHIRRGSSSVQVRCGMCGAEGPEALSDQKAVEKWNESDGIKIATGNEMVESAKLVEEIIGELRSFDETPPPKRAWLDISNRLEKAFGEYREGWRAAFSKFMGGVSSVLDNARERLKIAAGDLNSVKWKETMFLDLQTYDAGDGVYVLRCKHGEPNEHYCIINALNEEDAIRRAVFDLHKPSEHIGNVGKLRNVLSRTLEWIGFLIRDSKPGNGCSKCMSVSDLADDLYDALNSPVRNCDRFNDELDAQIEFLNEVWLISVDRESMLERDKFENWTPEMKARYAKWLMEMKDTKEGGDKCDPTDQKEQKA